MPFSFAGLTFPSNLGFYGLLSLIPLIILYLIRPKPKFMQVPSLMFFMKMTGANKLTSFLKQITKDWLFLVQLLLLLLLALALFQPYSFYTHDITSSNTVLVIDVSASMQLKESGTTRFAKAVSKAKDLIGTRNTIILAKQVPFIGAKDASSTTARDYLSTLKPTESTTRLGDAILLAGESLGGKEGRVVVISDFVNTGGQDPGIAKAVLQARGLTVDFINVGTPRDVFNVGFVDAQYSDDTITVYAKNFDKKDHAFTITGPGFSKDVALSAGGAEPISVKVTPGLTTLQINVDDEFPADNLFRISSPDKLTASALLISNDKSVFLENALTAGGFIELTTAEPPVVPSDNFDIYILQGIDELEVLSGTFENILSKVRNGATAIVYAQKNMANVDYKGLFPFAVSGTGSASSVTPQQLTKFTRDLEFGSVDSYPIISPDDSTVILTAGADPLLAVKQVGKGKIVFYGIMDEASDFKFAPDYPVFWAGLLRFLTQKDDLQNMNYKTGQTMILDTPRSIILPSGEKLASQSLVALDNAGFYTVGPSKYAVNLLDELESSLNAELSTGQKSIEYQLHPVNERRKFEFETWVIWIALLVVIGEVVFVKKRGDV